MSFYFDRPVAFPKLPYFIESYFLEFLLREVFKECSCTNYCGQVSFLEPRNMSDQVSGAAVSIVVLESLGFGVIPALSRGSATYGVILGNLLNLFLNLLYNVKDCCDDSMR